MWYFRKFENTNIRLITAETCIWRPPNRNEGEGLPEAAANITPKLMASSQTQVCKGQKKPLLKRGQFDKSEYSYCSGNNSAKISATKVTGQVKTHFLLHNITESSTEIWKCAFSTFLNILRRTVMEIWLLRAFPRFERCQEKTNNMHQTGVWHGVRKAESSFSKWNVCQWNLQHQSVTRPCWVTVVRVTFGLLRDFCTITVFKEELNVIFLLSFFARSSYYLPCNSHPTTCLPLAPCPSPLPWPVKLVAPVTVMLPMYQITYLSILGRWRPVIKL